MPFVTVFLTERDVTGRRQMRVPVSTSAERPARRRWQWLGLLGLLLAAQPLAAPGTVQAGPRLSEPVSAGASLAELARSDERIAAALTALDAQAKAKGRVKVAVKTAVAFAPESGLSARQRIQQRRDIAAAAKALRKALPGVKRFAAMTDLPYVTMTVDAQGLARLAAIPGLSRITPADQMNWMRDRVENVQAAMAEARGHADTGGTASKSPSLRIVGGRIADPTTHPFQTGILNRSIKANGVAWFCGGTLVSPTHVVTAAHCVSDQSANSLDVLVGTQRLDGSGRRVAVSRIYLAPGWFMTEETLGGPDAAVLELATPVTGIPFATLANTEPTVAGTMLRITGWGNRSPLEDGKDYPVDLMQADLPLTFQNCYAEDYEFCLGGNRIANTCSGDSGGPATINRGAGYTELAGITSWNSGCQPDDYPAGFTNVANSVVNRFIRGVVFAPSRTIAYQVAAPSVSEGAKSVTLVLERPSTEGTAQVSFATANGTAIFRPDAYFKSDYWSSSGTVTFWPGQAKAEIKITLVDDKEKEKSEFFTVTLSRPSAGWKIGGNPISIVTITDND